MLSFPARSQTTDLVILNTTEADRLKNLIAKNEQAKHHHDSIVRLASQHLKDQPRPLRQMFYEGLLETDPDRINTRKSLADIDKVVDFIYASYGSSPAIYAKKAKEIVLAWASTYQPTGNTINENKFVPLFWAYYLFKKYFQAKKKRKLKTGCSG